LIVSYTYEPEILDALGLHGFSPGPMTPPAFVRDALSDLYRYEIRRLRRRLLGGEVPKGGYVEEVIALRRKYWLLSVPPAHWAAAGD
jgi:hypothetical protein